MAAWGLLHFEEQNTPCRQLQTIETKLILQQEHMNCHIRLCISKHRSILATNYSKYEHGMALISSWMTFFFLTTDTVIIVLDYNEALQEKSNCL